MSQKEEEDTRPDDREYDDERSDRRNDDDRRRDDREYEAPRDRDRDYNDGGGYVPRPSRDGRRRNRWRRSSSKEQHRKRISR